MPRFIPRRFVLALLCAMLLSIPAMSAQAAAVLVNTGNPDGRIATLSRPGANGLLETESADDFILPSGAILTGASFTGLLTQNATIADITQVRVEIYRVFPKDSDTNRIPNVPTRTNSPSDVAFAERDSAVSDLNFSALSLGSFTANNSVINGINPKPNQQTGGEGAVTGQEVTISTTFNPLLLPADHYFFIPQVLLSSGDFLWLSVPKPIVAPGTPFLPDLQSWIRNENLAPDWLRIGTDIVGGNPAPTFNAAFELTGSAVPEPASMLLLASGVTGFVAWKRRRMEK